MSGFKASRANPPTVTTADLEVDSGTLSVDATNNRLGVGTTSPKTELTVEGTITVKERASAAGDTAAYGQLWVKSNAPCDLFFTDDSGQDVRLTNDGNLAAAASAGAVAADDISAGDANISIAGGSSDTITINATEAQAQLKTTTSGEVDITSAANIDVNSVTHMTFDTSGAAGHIAITSAHTAGDAILISANANAGSILDIDAGILDVDIQGAITIDSSAAGFSIDGVLDSNLTVTASGQDLDLAVAGGGTQELRLASAGTGASAIHLNASAGGINIDSADMIDIDAADEITITTTSADGHISLVSAHTAGQAVHIDADADAGSIVDIDAGILDIDVTGTTTITTGGLFKVETDGAEIENASDAGAAALLIDNNDTDQIALHIEAANIDGNVIDIDANAVTTANVIDVSCDDTITTGHVMHIDVNNAETGARARNDGYVHVDFDKDSNTDASVTAAHVGFSAIMHDSGTNNSSATGVVMKGAKFTATFANNTANTHAIAADLVAGGAANNVPLRLRNSAATNDYVDFTMDTNGALTITTLDAAGAQADLNLSVDGKVVVNAAASDEAVFNEGGVDVDFRVESVDDTHMIFVEGSSNRVSVGVSTDAPAALLEVTGDADTGVPLMQLNNLDVDKGALDIDAANTTADILTVDGDAITSGKLARFASNSSTTDNRGLVSIINEHASSTGAIPLTVRNDAIPTAGRATVKFEDTGNNTRPILLLKNSNDSANGPILRFDKARGAAGQDGDIIGNIHFFGFDDAGTPAEQKYAGIVVTIGDATAADAAGKMHLQVCEQTGGSGTVTTGLLLDGDTGADGRIDATIGAGAASVTTIAGTLDLGDRNITNVGDVSLDSISSDGALVTINAPAEIANGSSGGATALIIDNDDTDQKALEIQAANIDANVIDVTANAVTTAKLMNLSATGLTTGKMLALNGDSDVLNGAKLLDIYTDSTSTDDYKMLSITKDSTEGDNTNPIIGLDIDFDMTAGTAGRAFRIISDQTTGDVAEIKADGLTSGDAFTISSNSSDTTARSLLKITNDHASATATSCIELDQDSTGDLITAAYGANGTGFGLKIKEVFVDLGDEITSGEAIHDISGFFPALAVPIAFSIRVVETLESGKHITKIGTNSEDALIAGGNPDGVLDAGMLEQADDLLTMPLDGQGAFAGAMASVMGLNAAKTLRITVGGNNPNAGQVRCVLFYWDITPPTS